PGRTAPSRAHNGRGPSARGPRQVAPDAAMCLRTRLPWVTVDGADKIATSQKELELAARSRPPADTAPGPGGRRAPPRELCTLWSPAVPRRGQCAGSRRDGSALASQAESAAARSQWSSG